MELVAEMNRDTEIMKLNRIWPYHFWETIEPKTILISMNQKLLYHKLNKYTAQIHSRLHPNTRLWEVMQKARDAWQGDNLT